MGLLDSIVGSLTGSQNQNQNPNLLLQMVTGLIQQHGGIEGIVQKFAAQGLGAQAQQWVSNGPNPPITGDHVHQALGNDTVQQAADQLGVPSNQAASGLAALLPLVIDKLTPNGQSVNGAELENNIANLLKGSSGGLGDLAKLFGK